MSALPVETNEPDPAATSLPNDETVNKEGADKSSPSAEDTAVSNVKSEEVKEANGSAEVKEEKSEKPEEKTTEKDGKKFEKNGHFKKGGFNKEHERDNSQFRRHFNTYPKGPNHSKYDPSVLEATDDHKQIRAQVGSTNFKLSFPKTDKIL